MRTTLAARAALVGLGLLAGCWASFPEDRFGKHPDARVPDLPLYEPRPSPEAGPGPETSPPPPDRSTVDRHQGDLLHCIPNGQLACTSDSKGLIKCSPGGWGTVVVDCSPFKCQDLLRRCAGCDPGSSPSCDKLDLVVCSLDGLPQRVPCPHACKDGACQ